MTAVTSRLWRLDGSGDFDVEVAGTSHYTDAISRVAGNPAGQRALTFGLARLERATWNTHHNNAVAVFVGAAQVGHLAASLADALAPSWLTFEGTYCTLLAAAVITDGIKVGSRQYNYTVELDVADWTARPIADTYDPELQVGFGYAPLKATGRGHFEVRVWLPVPKRLLQAGFEVDIFAAESWDEVGVFLHQGRRIGLGQRIYAISKRDYNAVFAGRPATATLSDLEHRFATLTLSADM